MTTAPALKDPTLSRWPSLPLAELEATRDTPQLWTQIEDGWRCYADQLAFEVAGAPPSLGRRYLNHRPRARRLPPACKSEVVPGSCGGVRKQLPMRRRGQGRS